MERTVELQIFPSGIHQISEGLKYIRYEDLDEEERIVVDTTRALRPVTISGTVYENQNRFMWEMYPNTVISDIDVVIALINYWIKKNKIERDKSIISFQKHRTNSKKEIYKADIV